MAEYRNLSERRATRGQNETESRALTRAKMRAEVLNSVHMIDRSEVCELLELSVSNPSAALERLEDKGEILRFDHKGKAVYPLFQFDVTGRRVYPVLLKLIKMRTDDWGNSLAFLHWLTRPNRSLSGARPCDRLGDDSNVIVRSFAADISEPLNG